MGEVYKLRPGYIIGGSLLWSFMVVNVSRGPTGGAVGQTP